jgi:putative FmdB family regulatory protein
MPTYDYQCQDCGYTFEVFQSMTARKLRKCPRCDGRLKRLLGTGAGIIFKGSGFYATDYRSPSYLEGEKKEKKESKPAPSKKSPPAKSARSAPPDKNSGR